MEQLYGRKVLYEEIAEAILLVKTEKINCMKKISEDDIQCLRCGQIHGIQTVQLMTGNSFCPTCIQLGRVVSNQFFYHLPEPKCLARTVRFVWNGKLSDGQQTIANQLVQAIHMQCSKLVWAVTGSGKTEMLFHMLHYSLEKGYRVAVCSPRVDVCLELFPRIQSVFPNEQIALLYGEQKQKYHYTKLVICTTHQLLRFYEAFDVIVIDEVNAFPFVNNDCLAYGVTQAVKKHASIIYLTATPSKQMMQQVQNKELSVGLLPARYHRRIVPVPQSIWCTQWNKKLQNGKIPKIINRKILHMIKQNNLLIFCPSIYLIERLFSLIEQYLPNISCAFVHSKDPNRLKKVMNMRENKYKILITSTVLERGVTFENVSVIVIGANHPVFTTSTLVQIAGRVDRKMHYHFGEVCFLHDGATKAMKKAIYQIKEMNKQGIKRGLIDEMLFL